MVRPFEGEDTFDMGDVTNLLSCVSCYAKNIALFHDEIENVYNDTSRVPVEGKISRVCDVTEI